LKEIILVNFSSPQLNSAPSSNNLLLTLHGVVNLFQLTSSLLLLHLLHLHPT